MRLDAEKAEPAGHGAGRDALDLAHAVGALAGGVRGLFLHGAVDHLGDPFVVVGARAAGAEFVMQALDAAVEIVLAPLADSLRRSGARPRRW